jgi:hypothetical protein
MEPIYRAILVERVTVMARENLQIKEKGKGKINQPEKVMATKVEKINDKVKI